MTDLTVMDGGLSVDELRREYDIGPLEHEALSEVLEVMRRHAIRLPGSSPWRQCFLRIAAELAPVVERTGR